MAEKRTDISTQSSQPLTRRHLAATNPFRMLDRFADEMDRMFGEFGLGRGWAWPSSVAGGVTWSPQIDVSQKNNELVVRADLPGLTKDDVKVDITDDTITIQGERRKEHEEERGGVYRAERSYGSFYRTIPLPDGTITDQAKASFKDGVLEITMPAPPEQVTRGRRLEITEGAAKK
ncbi:MAG TPA: Hsp20/alpha crystallin family protein [Vicinamibacterales bacterium]|nr:Hsp20/alpha crystallin family protein [Vicinamibacterales bacterium]